MVRMEWFIGQVLRWGLLLSVGIVLVGGTIYLAQHGQEPIPYHVFLPNEHNGLNTMMGIFRSALTLSAVGIIQFGLLLLVLTQVLRVGLTALLFIIERDYLFTWISVIILSVLIYSVFWRV